ncbi:MAG: energy transducer TonB [Candidatus Thiodiazotropha sp.]
MSTHTPAFLISALIHLGLLALVLTGVAQLPSDIPQDTRLAVSLEMFQPPPPPPEPDPEPVVEPEPEPEPEPEVVEPPPEPKPKPKPEPKPKPKPEPKPKPQPKPPPKPKPAPVEKPVEPVKLPPPPMPAVNLGLIQRLEAEYKARLRRAIETNKGYPRRAVRMRQEGEVVVGFTIRRNGVIENLRIVESSGSKLLDKAARKAVEKTSGRLPFPDQLERNAWEFTIPINYSLR